MGKFYIILEFFIIDMAKMNPLEGGEGEELDNKASEEREKEYFL